VCRVPDDGVYAIWAVEFGEGAALGKADLFEKGAVVIEEEFLDDLAVLPACGGRVEDVERFACGLDGVAVGQF
jgi:hypothetical protein